MYSPELLAAVAVLDKDQPGWWRKVDLGTFTLAGTNHCICGQVYGPDEMVRLWYRLDEVAGSFLNTSVFTPHKGYEPQWRSLIEVRQATDNLILPAPPCEESEAVEGHERVMV